MLQCRLRKGNRRSGGNYLENIDPDLRARILEAMCADLDIQRLVMAGSRFDMEAPPFYDPDKNYINKDMDEAISRARALGLSIAPHLDPATMVWIFVDAQREIINSLRPKT
jgi:hypothetical protein